MASNGTYVFEGCMPTGELDIANVTPGEIVQRTFTFAVNLPPRLETALDSGELDPRNILTGIDGVLLDESGQKMLMVNEWSMTMEMQDTDYQAAGNAQVWTITTGYKATLTFTEAVINDDRVAYILSGLSDPGRRPSLTFTGKLYGHGAA